MTSLEVDGGWVVVSSTISGDGDGGGKDSVVIGDVGGGHVGAPLLRKRSSYRQGGVKSDGGGVVATFIYLPRSAGFLRRFLVVVVVRRKWGETAADGRKFLLKRCWSLC